MNKDDIIRMAQEAGVYSGANEMVFAASLERFAELVIAREREPLTLGQKQRLWSSLGNKPTLKDRVNAFGLAIEAAHGIFANAQNKENT